MKLTPYSLLVVLIIVFASCSKTAKIPVPADAGLVIHIDAGSLSSKLTWDEFRQGELYKMMDEEVKDALMKKILHNPDSSGIDLQSDAYLFMRNRGRNGYFGVVGKIKDEKAFRNFVSGMRIGTPVKQGDISVIGEDQMILTWSDDQFVMVTDVPGSAYGIDRESGSSRYSKDSLVRFATEVYEIGGKQSIGSDERFASLLKKDGDAHFWVNSGRLYGNALPGVLGMTKIGSLIEGNISAGTLNFENGKISFQSKTYYNKEMSELIKKYPPKNADETMLAKLPSDNVVGALLMNYPPEGLKAFLSLLGLDGLINTFLADMNYSLDEFIKGNKGDIMFAAADFGLGQRSYYDSTTKQEYPLPATPTAKFLFATSIGDQASFDKLVTLVQEKIVKGGMLEKAGNIPYGIKNNIFVAGNDAALVNSYGGNKTHAFASKISGHPFGAYLNLQQLISGF
jgi:hypothetical protein